MKRTIQCRHLFRSTNTSCRPVRPRNWHRCLTTSKPCSSPNQNDNNKNTNHESTSSKDGNPMAAFYPQPGPSNSPLTTILAAFLILGGGVKIGYELHSNFGSNPASASHSSTSQSSSTTSSLSQETPPQYADHATMLRAVEEIRSELSKTSSPAEVDDLISVEDEVIHAHSYSEWSTTNSSNTPVAVVYPRSTEDVSLIARVCTKYRVPMVPFGAGSSVEGSFSAPCSGITVDFSRMDRILEVHADDMDCVVQPGVNWMTLNQVLEKDGLFLPLDPSPTALIGGMVNTNCSGTNAMRYGTMKDWVVNLTVVLADGTVLKTRRRPRKSSAGYDLTRLFVGSEGTLGFITECTVKLAVVPRVTGVATVSFRDVKTASGAAVKMMREGIGGLAALELMDEAQMRVINKNGGTTGADGKRRLWREKPTLFLKFAGGSEKGVEEDVKRVREVASMYGGSKLEHATNEKEKNAIWAARKEALWAMIAQRDEGTEIWSTDTAVPLSRLAEIIDISQKESSQLGLFNTVMGHVGDGNFHQSVMYHPNDPEEARKVGKCVSDMMERALEMEGTIAGEHAIGLGKKKTLVKEVGENSIDLMRRLKQSMDPYWLMNPSKVFDHPAVR